MRFIPFVFSLLIMPALVAAEEQPKVSLPSEAPKEVPRIVMARVGSQEITVEDFMQFLAKNPTRVQEATTPDGKAQLLREAIANTLLMQAMKEEGKLPENPDETAMKKAFLAIMSKHFPSPPAPDEATLRAYYQEHQATFGIPASVRLSQILLQVADDASDEVRAATRKRAEDALKRIESGESFANVASELSENPRAKANKGDVGFVWRHGSDWLEAALKGVKVGDHTGIVDSPAGYDILMVTDEREAVITPFEEAKDNVAKQWSLAQQKKARAAYVKQLADRIGVEIVMDEMKGSYPKGVFP